MTEPHRFIVKERAVTANDRLRLFQRLVSEMRFFRRMFPLSMVLLIVGLILPQAFIWLTGQVSSCDTLPCTLHLPYGLGAVEASIALFGGLLLLSILVQICTWLCFELSAQWSVLGLHAKMVQALSRTRATFFDEHPSGRIINRLVRDYEVLMQHVTVRFSDTIYFGFSIVLSVILTLLIEPLVIVLSLPLLGVVLYVQWQIALMNERVIAERSASLSSVLHRETDLIEGGRVYILYDALPTLIKRLCDAAGRFVHFHLWQIRIEQYGRSLVGLLRVLFTGTVLLVTVFSLKTGGINEALALVLLSQLPPLQNKFGGFAWSWLNTVQSFATVRRIFEYVDLESEKVTEGTPKQVSTDARAAFTGPIKFHNYSMSYRPHLPRILDGLTVEIPFKKRVALVGRTGSGKSTLVQALFRMGFVQDGDITIGGRSIFTAAHDEIRSKFVVIPQEPYLFAGTLEENLDFTRSASKHEINAALAIVGVTMQPHEVLLEGGSNVSLGERQLICLARALLSKAEYVIMDEPTSSVDTITDAKMQRIIREQFAHRSVITIAHRLETISDYDWIIELQGGKVVFEGSVEEFGRQRDSSEGTTK